MLCLCIGKGDVLPELKALAKELRVEGYLWFTGWIPDENLARCLCTADICVDLDPSNPFTNRSPMVRMMEYVGLSKLVVPLICLSTR